jgi:hypothetical protein
MSSRNRLTAFTLINVTLLVPYIFDYTNLVQSNVHCLCSSTQLFIKDCPTCFEPIQEDEACINSKLVLNNIKQCTFD